MTLALAACGSGHRTGSPGASGAADASTYESTAGVGEPIESPTGSSVPGVAPAPTTASAANLYGPGSIPDIVSRLEPSVVAILRSDGAQGSGVVWDAGGYIVTNNHVVEGFTTVTVVFASGRHEQARVVATDPRTDLAAVRVSTGDLPAATFRKGLPEVGEEAIAIGNPLGFGGSATAGIVSGLGREIPGSAQQSAALVDLIQTDAGISPGNSGGALVGADGQVIGISVAYIPPSAGAVSIGFAIPSPTVIDVVTQLIKKGSASHAYIGAGVGTLTSSIVRSYGLKVDAGVVVGSVAPGGPADAAGIQPGDVIVSFNGKDMASAEDLFAALRQVEPGQTVQVGIVRDPQTTSTPQTVSITLGDLPATSIGSGPGSSSRVLPTP